MELIKELIIVDNKAEMPIYLQITNAFIQNIMQGRLRKGLKLPGSRQTAALLKVNRMTVVAAFGELDAQGWIETFPKKGTFVKMNLPLVTPRKITELKEGSFKMPDNTGFSYDVKRIVPVKFSDFGAIPKLGFNDGFPDTRIVPIEHLIKTMRRLARLPSQRKFLMYGGAQGTMFLRETLSTFLSDTRGLPISAENILVTKGAQMGLFIAASVILKPGDEVIVGVPGYTAATLTFQQLYANINYVHVDEEGMDVEAVEKISKKKKIKLVYAISHHHNPTTVTLTPERRIRLLELAGKYKFAIVEDDYDYDFHYSSKPIMPMASLDKHGNVIYLGTFTKTLAPAIRFGFIVGPASFVRSATHFRKSVDSQGDSLMENAIAELHHDGTIARHIKKSVKLYKERRDTLCNLLSAEIGEHISFRVPDGGMAVWTKFNADMSRVSEMAAKKGLVIKDGKDYDANKLRFNSVRLGFASLDLNEQKTAVGILKDVLRQV